GAMEWTGVPGSTRQLALMLASALVSAGTRSPSTTRRTFEDTLAFIVLRVQSNLHLALDERPLLGLPEAAGQLVKGRLVRWAKLEPGEKIEGSTEIVTVIEAARDGRKVFATDRDMPRSLLEDRASLVLWQRPPLSRFLDRNQRRSRARGSSQI